MAELSTYVALHNADEIDQLNPAGNEVSEETADKGNVKVTIDLPEDAYGASMFAIIYDARELMSETDHDAKPWWLNMYRLMYVMLVLLVNYMFQFLMLYWIFTYIVQPAVADVQRVYDQYHGEFFSVEGEFMHEVWNGKTTFDDARYKQDLCHVVFSRFTFLWFVLILWMTQMVIELRTNMALTADLFHIPHCPNDKAEGMIQGTGGGLDETDADDDELHVVSLTPIVRWTIVFSVVIPKLLIGFALTVMGMMWLSSTQSFSDLILNSLALEFVVRIDDNLYSALIPEHFKEDMGRVKLVYEKKQKTLEEEIHDDWVEWRTATIWLVVIPSFVFVYLKMAQGMPILGVLPYFQNDIAEACAPYLEREKMRICENGFGSERCFAFGGWVQ